MKQNTIVKTMQITQSVFKHIQNTVGTKPAETGGLLFGSRKDFIVRYFVFDEDAEVTNSTYSFNTGFLNPMIKRLWEEKGLELLGFLHSHPTGCNWLSHPDQIYFQRQFKNIPIDKFLTPIVFSKADGVFDLVPFVFHRQKKNGMKVEQWKLKIIPDDEVEHDFTKETLKPSNPKNKKTVSKNLTDFSRIQGAFNIPLLQKKHIVGVGAGGAYTLYNSLCRSGVGKLTVLDFDAVDESNLTRQGYNFEDINTLKVEALGKKLSLINEDLDYQGITKNFLEMSDTELDAIFGKADLFLFLTDSFEAQSFGNKLALKYRKPSIWAGYYSKSHCSEIIFTIPGITPACFRCAVSSRYEAQANSKSEIKVDSGLNTIFHSQLLDAKIGMLTMAILHNDTEGYEFSNWFGNYWDRNLIQFKTHPSYGTRPNHLFERTFSKEHTFNFNSVWQKLDIERPPKYGYTCPDCNGLGGISDEENKYPCANGATFC